MIERYTGRKLITQTLTGYAMPFNANDELWWEGYRTGHVNILNGPLSHIQFDWGPVASVTSVESIDTDNVETAYAASNYYLDNYDDDIMPRIVFNSDAASPAGLRARDAWKVVFVAGYGANSTDVPADIRRALILLAGKLWGNRGVCDDGKCMTECGAAALLERFRLAPILS